MSEKNKPICETKIWPVRVAVWENEGKGRDGKPVKYLSYQLERVYKDKDGKWQSTDSLRRQDVLQAAKALEMAYIETSGKRESDEEGA